MQRFQLVTKNKILLYHDLIDSLVKVMDSRDLYTAYHSERVADMSVNICHLLKLGRFRTNMIHIAAHLHDIGKIGIPDSVLLNERPLTSEEWELMKTHPDIGYYILKHIKGFERIAKIVRCHHERLDGTGYPHRLTEKEIPLGAKVIAVADSIDAMLSRRVYRDSLSEEQCRQELFNNRETHYDPLIINLVLDNWDDVLVDVLKQSK